MKIKVYFLYLLIGFAAFLNGLHGPFMLDDHAFFDSEIKDIRHWTDHFIPKAYKSQETTHTPHGQPNFYYRPFAKILPSVAYAMFQQNVFLYHLFNLLLFVTAGFMIYVFLLAFSVLGQWGAFMVGLLYIIHPVNGVVVNYITASVFAVQVICMIASLMLMRRRQWAGIPVLRQNNDRLAAVLDHLGFCLFYVFSLLCHETALLLPLYAAIFHYDHDANISIRQRLLDCFKRTWLLWAVTAGWLVFRFTYASLEDGLIAKFARFGMNPIEYAASVGKLIFWYVSKLFVPWDIVLIWATPVVRAVQVFIWLSVLVMLISFAFYVVLRAKDRVVWLGMSWFAAGFLPLPLMCLFQPTHGPMIEPHWFVFSVIGFFICVGRVLETIPVQFRKTAVALLLAVLLVSGWRHNYLWADEKRYAHYWSEQAPTIKSVWFHLGDLYFRQRLFPEAAGFYERSIRGTYQDYLAYQRMGLAYFEIKDYVLAQFNFMMTLKLEPRQPRIRERLDWINRQLQ